jgi:PAS domain S-box-containing protein
MPTYEELEIKSLKLEQRVAALEKEILDLKEVENKLTESKETFKTLFEHSAFVIDVIDAETGIPILQNKRFREQMGHTLDKMMRANSSKAPPKEHLLRHFQHVINKGATIFERKFFTKDGDERNFITSAVPIKLHGKWYIQNISFDITEHHQALIELKEREKDLEELNAALKVLLKRRDDEKIEIEDGFIASLDELIEPYIHALKDTPLNPQQDACLSTLESNLNQMKSPFIRGLSFKHSGFTHKELQIATLIRDGKTTKEISESLASSIRSIEFHRANIRKKLGIKNAKANLRTLLLSHQK